MRTINVLALVLALLACNAAAKKPKESAEKPKAAAASPEKPKAAAATPEQPKAAATSAGIYSMESLTQTGTLLKDLATFAIVSAHDALPPAAQEAIDKAQTEVSTAYDKHGKAHVDTITKIVSGPYAAGMDFISQKMEAIAPQVDAILEKFEKLYPSSKGAIPTSMGDRLVALFLVLTVLSWGFWIVKKVLGMSCFFLCCCGMCSKRAKGKKGKGEKAAAAPKPKPKMKK
jgi:hypothetical protein